MHTTITPPPESAAYDNPAPAPSAAALHRFARLLDREFGPGRVARFEDVDFPPTLTHAPTRRFLTEVGLPEHPDLFHHDSATPLPTLAEYYTEEHPDTLPTHELPPRSTHLIRLGTVPGEDAVVADGETGGLLTWNELTRTVHPLHNEVSALVFTLWLRRHERR
ncbi:SUKH-4 family immunity protein [Streptomyces sp. 7R007]